MSGQSTGPLVLVAHGSRDPEAAAATQALADAVRAARPGTTVRVSYLDHTLPRPAQVLGSLQDSGAARATLVPLLLTRAYHGRVDLPAELAAARADGVRIPVAVADVLGPTGGGTPPQLLDALCRRLAEAGDDVDGLVLAAAGTRNAAARATVEQVARELGERLGVCCAVAYASAAPPTAGAAVTRLRDAGARRIGMAAYFLAPGLLYRIAAESASDAGARTVAAPLRDVSELADLVLSRADATVGNGAVEAA